MSSSSDNQGSSQEKKQGTLHNFFKASAKKNDANPDSIRDPPLIQRRTSSTQQSNFSNDQAGNSSQSSSNDAKQEGTKTINRNRTEKDGDQVMGEDGSPTRHSNRGNNEQGKETPFKGGARKKKKMGSPSTNASAVVSPNQGDKEEEAKANQDQQEQQQEVASTEDQQQDQGQQADSGKGNQQPEEDESKAEESKEDAHPQANGDQVAQQAEDDKTNQDKVATDKEENNQMEVDTAPDSTEGQKKGGVSFQEDTNVYNIDLCKRQTKEWRAAYSSTAAHSICEPFMEDDAADQVYLKKLMKVLQLIADERGVTLESLLSASVTELQGYQKDCFRPSGFKFN